MERIPLEEIRNVRLRGKVSLAVDYLIGVV